MEEEVVKELPCSDGQESASQSKDKQEEQSSLFQGQHCMDREKADVAATTFAKELVVPNNLVPTEGENTSAQICQDLIPPSKCKEGKEPSSMDWRKYMNQVKIEIEEEPSTEKHQHSVDLVKIAVQSETFSTTQQEPINTATGVSRDQSCDSSMDLEKIEEGEKSSAHVRPGSSTHLKNNGEERSPVHMEGHMVQVKIKEEESLTGDHQQSMDWVKIKVGDERFTKNHQGFGGLDSAEGEDSSSRSCWGSVHSVKIEERDPQDYYPSVRWEEGKEQSMVGWTDSVNQVNIEGKLASGKEEHQELIKWVTFKDETKTGPFGRNGQVGRKIRSSVDGHLLKTDAGLIWHTTPVVRVASQAMQYANEATSSHPRRRKRSAKKISSAARARKARFTEEATNVLVDLVLPRYNRLFGDQSRRVPLQQKKMIWQGIADRVNSVSTIKRTWRETKKRWYDIKKRIREKYHEAKRHVNDTDGENVVKLELSPAEAKVLKMMDCAFLEGLGGIDTLIDQPNDSDRSTNVVIEKQLEVIDVSDDPLLQHDIPVEVEEEAATSHTSMPAAALDVSDHEEKQEIVLHLQDCTENIVGPNTVVSSLPNVLSVEQEVKTLPEVAPQAKSTFRMRRPCSNAVVEHSDFAQKALDDQSKLLECSQQQSKAVLEICSHVQKYIRVVKKHEGNRHADAITVSGELVRVASALENVTVALVKSQESHVALMEKIAAQNEILCKTQMENNLMLKSLVHVSGKQWRPENQDPDVSSPDVTSETVMAPSSTQFCTERASPSMNNGPLHEMGRRGRKRSAEAVSKISKKSYTQL